MANATCVVEGCPKQGRMRGLCSMHYYRLRTRGDVGSAGPERHRRGTVQCSVADCPRSAVTKGYCNRHYENLRKYGDPIPQRDRPLDVRLREIGWTVTGTGCWEWNGKRNDNGYGLFTALRLGYDGARAHRVMYEHFTEPIPDGLILRHKCDNPPCVNPDHLIPGTAADNSRDMVERGRQKDAGRTECGNGHDLALSGAVKVTARPGGTTENNCVECERNRKARYAQRKRKAA